MVIVFIGKRRVDQIYWHAQKARSLETENDSTSGSPGGTKQQYQLFEMEVTAEKKWSALNSFSWAEERINEPLLSLVELSSAQTKAGLDLKAGRLAQTAR